MTATELIEILLQMPGVRWSMPVEPQKAATTIINTLLGEEPRAKASVCEASVHQPRSGSIWVAVFTGPTGGQVWKTTGMTDREQALVLAREWEAQARTQRRSLGRTRSTPFLRVRRQEPGTTPSGLLTQREVAQLLKMSERGIREVERRAFEKLRQHPLLRQVWQQFLTGELHEYQLGLTPEEIEALFNLARTPEERFLIEKVLRLIQRWQAALAVANRLPCLPLESLFQNLPAPMPVGGGPMAQSAIMTTHDETLCSSFLASASSARPELALAGSEIGHSSRTK